MEIQREKEKWDMGVKMTDAQAHAVNVKGGTEIFICGSNGDPSMYMIGQGETQVKEIGKYINQISPNSHCVVKINDAKNEFISLH